MWYICYEELFFWRYFSLTIICQGYFDVFLKKQHMIVEPIHLLHIFT